MSRIGFIRNIVSKRGGAVRKHYANGPGTIGGFGSFSDKVLYKVDVTGVYDTDYGPMFTDLEANPEIEKAYRCRNGYLKVVFAKRAR